MSFSLGKLVATQNVMARISNNFIQAALALYLQHDWGETSESGKKQNDDAIESGEDRIFAVYETPDGKIWIITEADRSYTTVLLPEDY